MLKASITALVAVVLLFVLAACSEEGSLNPVPDENLQLQGVKTPVCHYQQDKDAWKLIMVGGNAMLAHRNNHNDDFPGNPVPDVEGYKFDEDCVAYNVLGLVWHETEGVVFGDWDGTWTRQGTSNMFKAKWTHQSNPPVYADLTITSVGNQVTVDRDDTNGPNGPEIGSGCDYQGTLAPDGITVEGTYSCDLASGPFLWTATITR